MRTLTSAAQTEAAKTNGAQPLYILQVDFPSGTVYWSDQTLSSPVTASGKILSWGDLSLRAKPGEAGSVGDMRITVTDTDHSLKQAAAAQPGWQDVDATLYLYFMGTTWATDRITIHSGVLTTPCSWNEADGSYEISLKDRGHKYDKNVGTVMKQSIFPEINCKSCENELLPIVYGNPCRRVPACVIDRPGVAQLASTLTSLPPSTTLTIDQGAAPAGFTETGSIDLIVGFPGRWERITGSFSSSDDTTFTITSRGSIYASGTVGSYAAGGVTYITIPKADLADGGAQSRGGSPLLLQKNDASWIGVYITHWWETGTVIVVCIKGSDMTVNSGNNYQLLNTPGEIPHYPAGTPVSEDAPWTYAVNAVPSKSVDSVEVRARVNVQGGDSHVKWATLNAAYYTTTLNDTSFNSQLGRDVSDPGITTIALDYPPTNLGMDDETVYVTLKGVTDDNTTTGTVLEDPALVIQNMLTNAYVGGLSSGLVNSSAFTAAAASISTKFSFALLDAQKKLMELCSELAYQANCIFFWDEGKAQIRYLEPDINTSSDGVSFEVTNANRVAGTLRISEVSIKEYITELTGKFRRTCVDDEQRIIRSSDEDVSISGANGAQFDFGLQRHEIDFWGYQLPSSVAKATEDWLRYYLRTNRVIESTQFLDAVALQPGDTVLFNVDDGAGNSILLTDARVQSVGMTLGNAISQVMPAVKLTCEAQLFSYGIQVATPDDTDCAGQNTSGGRARSQPLALRSDGRAMQVVAPVVPRLGVGTAGGTHGQDPTENLADVPPGAILPPTEGDPTTSSS